jgi:hypothetical protein
MKHICRAKAAFTEQRRQAQVLRWYRDPKLFWQDYKSKHGIACAAGLVVWSSYFKGVFKADNDQVGSVHSYHGGSVTSHVAAHKDKFPQVTEAHIHAAQWLNADFSEDEVSAAIALLKDHKATGVDGWPAEFISHACCFDNDGNEYNVLVPHITGLFNKILKYLSFIMGGLCCCASLQG